MLFFLLNTEEDILKNVDVAIDFRSIFFYSMELCLVTQILQNIFFCVRQNIGTTGVEQLEGVYMIELSL